MPKVSIFFGFLLIIDGAFGYFLGAPNAVTGNVSMTAWIPAFFGIALIICGAIASKAKEKPRMHIMHIAVLIGLIGLIGAITRIPGSLDKVNAGGSVIGLTAQSIMAFLCFVYLVLCIRSFVVSRLLAK